MDALSAETLDGLESALISLLPSPTDPTLKPLFGIEALRLAPVGLGGYVGTSDAPLGDRYGRRAEARVAITVKARPATTLDQVVTDSLRALVGADRETLRQLGIFGLVLQELGPRPVSLPSGAAAVAERAIVLKVQYEYVRTPSEAGDIIQEIPFALAIDDHVEQGRLTK